MAEITYIEAITEALREEMTRDPNVFLLGEDIGQLGGAFKATKGLLDEFGPLRVINTPMSESGVVGAAIGAALMGMRPVVEMQFADFISKGFDQLVNVAANSVWRWRSRRSLSFAVSRSVVYPRPGSQDRCPRYGE
jgi:2-oxoisovalerate dehydrogenase E1 component beta subunit